MEQILNEKVNSYIEFVNDMIAKYKKIGELIDPESGTVTPERINSALSLYYNVNLALCAEYQRAKINYEAMSIDFQDWKDRNFEEAKATVLAEYEDKKIKPSVTEFETRARTLHREEYTRRTMELSEADSRMRFLLRMLDTLNKFDSILTAISYNMRSELKALSLDDRMNASVEGVSQNKIRSLSGRRIPADNA